MTASVLGLGAVVVSDIAEAGAKRGSIADEPTSSPPVVQKKLLVKSAPKPEPVKKKKRISFGKFEGY